MSTYVMFAPWREITPVSRWRVPGRSTTSTSSASRSGAAATSADVDLDVGGHARVDERVAEIGGDAHRHLRDRLGRVRAAAGALGGLELTLRQVRHKPDDLAVEIAVQRVHVDLDRHARPDVLERGLVDVGDDPHVAKVGDG